MGKREPADDESRGKGREGSKEPIQQEGDRKGRNSVEPGETFLFIFSFVLWLTFVFFHCNHFRPSPAATEE